MNENVLKWAREAGYFLYDLTKTHGKKTVETDDDDEWAVLTRFAALVAAAERERIKESNAPVIKTINEHIKALEEARKAEREACAKVCDARYMGDNNREDMEARRCAEAIRARGNT
jgi:hypothetical protein